MLDFYFFFLIYTADENKCQLLTLKKKIGQLSPLLQGYCCAMNEILAICKIKHAREK